jgi:predicted transcriptional regulator of viral defense system
MIEGSEIHFVKVVERKFFGFKSYDLYGREAAISTPTKTVVDCLDRPDLTGGVAELARIVYGAAVDANPEDVIDTAFRMKSTALVQRLGFLSELIGWKWPAALRARLRAAIAPSIRAVLGRSERKAGDIGYVAAWGLLVNIRESDLLADVPRVKRRGKI